MKNSKIDEEEDNWGYRRYSIVVRKSSLDYQEIDELCFKSKNLFNATLYDERQSYFKTGEFRFYQNVNRDFTQNNQPDYRALPVKVSKHTQMKVNEAINRFLSLKKSAKVTFEPNIPKYLKKDGRFVTEYEKGALSFKREGFIKLSKTNIYIPIPDKFKVKGKSKGKDLKKFFQVVRLVPKNGYYLIEVLYKKSIPKKKKERIYSSNKICFYRFGCEQFGNSNLKCFSATYY